MELKRIYRFPENWEPIRNEKNSVEPTKRNPLGLRDPSKQEGIVLNPPPTDHFIINHTGTKPEQNFSEGLVQAGITEGFATVSRGELVLHAEPEDLVYEIIRGPGHYCCHCGEPIPDANAFLKDENGEETDQTVGMLHVAEVHGGEKSPDPNNPSGYMRLNGYQCRLSDKLHKKYNFELWQRKRMEGPKRKGKESDNG
jgi:hypothetical protein